MVHTSSNRITIECGTARNYPFGAWRTTPSQTLTDRGYTGHRHNNDLGLIYMNARYYVPYINRFLSADTIVPDREDPQSFNRYSYGLNNPLRYTDPTGHRVVEGAGGGGGAFCYDNPVGISTCGTAYAGAIGVASGAATHPDMQALVVNVGELAVGILWEPADWALSLRDGFQWYDSLGMLPLIPAAFGDNLAKAAIGFMPAGWADDAGHAIGHWVGRNLGNQPWARY